MPISLITEHDDFKKSRRALTIAAVGLFVVSSLDLKTEVIEILKLELGVSKIWLIYAGQASVVYLGFLFFTYSSSSNLERNPEIIDNSFREKIDAVRDTLRLEAKEIFENSEESATFSAKSPAQDQISVQSSRRVGIETVSEEIAKSIASILTSTIRYRVRLRMIADVILPALLAVVALIYSLEELSELGVFDEHTKPEAAATESPHA